MSHLHRIVTLVGIAVGWAGCGGSSSFDARADSGLPDDLVLEQASTAQKRAFCDYYLQAVFTDGVITGLCATGYIGLPVSTADCSDLVAQCVADSRAGIADGSAKEMCVQQFEDLPCASTVAELETCVGDIRTSLQSMFARIDCSTSAAEVSELASAAEPDSCAALTGACPAFFSEVSCCAADDPCSWGDDGYCDCPDQAWDAADCSATSPCCTANDTCGFGDDGFCDCPDQAWDAPDCSAGSDPCCSASDVCLFADDGYCDCPDERWDRVDCTPRCCDATDVCAWAGDGVCECPGSGWDVADCTPTRSDADAGARVTDAGAQATGAGDGGG